MPDAHICTLKREICVLPFSERDARIFNSKREDHVLKQPKARDSTPCEVRVSKQREGRVSTPREVRVSTKQREIHVQDGMSLRHIKPRSPHP